ncbi:IS30 family transposase [Actinomycetes bacterium M1A6_2h]
MVVRGAGRPVVPRSVQELFWAERVSGKSVRDAAIAVGVSKTMGRWWVQACGGIRPRRRPPSSGRFLDLLERVRIESLLTAQWTFTAIARELGRAVSTVSREVKAHSNYRGKYSAVRAQREADASAKRPKPTKLAPGTLLHEHVQQRLGLKHSPEQISATLPVEFPDLPEMRVSQETIYQSLYVQGRGGLRRELTVHLRSGRSVRRPRVKPGETRGRIVDMVNISERPAEVADRAVPGHWEGDLILGAGNASAIGTLVERTTRFLMLLHLPNAHNAFEVRAAMEKVVQTLPAKLFRSVTWDQGKEMSGHAAFTVATGVQVYFCDPHSPWQRGSNENTNGILRQYFPKGTDLSKHSAEYLSHVADQINDRPRKTLSWNTPTRKLEQLLVATTA